MGVLIRKCSLVAHMSCYQLQGSRRKTFGRPQYAPHTHPRATLASSTLLLPGSLKQLLLVATGRVRSFDESELAEIRRRLPIVESMHLGMTLCAMHLGITPCAMHLDIT